MSTKSKYAIASRLAQFLRRNGDKVVNGSCKLSLTTSALCLLNTLFAEIISNDEILGISTVSGPCPSDISADVKFLYDFMKRTSSLKLFHGVQTLRGGVDLSHFSSLTALELRKIPAHLIVGLDLLSLQLKVLIVSRSIYLLKEIFGPCVDEDNFSNTWMELKELNLSYNYLETLDESLDSVPNVEVIDLSHNNLINVTEIQALKKLTFVNLSYNKLPCMPFFDIATCRSLTKFYCRNNILNDLEGLDCLFNLQELDVGYNLLSEYHVLNPLDKLKSLRVLNLEGNPLFFHRRHVTLVASYVNENAIHNGLLLNGSKLPVPHNMAPTVTNIREIPNHHQTSINTVVGDTDSIISVPYEANRLASSFPEQSSFDDNSISSINSLSGNDELVVEVHKEKKSRKRNSKTGKKKSKMRNVLITEPKEEGIQENADLVDNVGSPIPSHLRTKELIEARRNELGQGWLIPDSAFSRVMIPIPQVPSNTPISPSFAAPQVVSQMSLVSKINSSFANPDAEAPETVQEPLSAVSTQAEIIETSGNEVFVDCCAIEDQAPKENDDIEILSSNCEVDCCTGDLHGTLSKDNLSDCDIYENNDLAYIASDLVDENDDLDSEEESEDSIFIIHTHDKIEDQLCPLLIKIGRNYIKEKDAISARLFDTLDLKCLQSVDTSTKEKDGSHCCEVALEFNTVKSSRKKRLYIFPDFESAMVVVKKLQPFADANTLEEATVGALECLKCKSQFSKQVANRIVLKEKKGGENINTPNYDSNKEYPREVEACPNCGNHILIKMDTFPMPGASPPPAAVFPMNSSKSFSNSSPHSKPGVLASLFPSMKISPILKRKSVTVVPDELTQSLVMPTVSEINQSENNNTEDTEGPMRRISSDMTIMSNISQSSIAVIPDPEVNLHTILERHSLSSISPPISQDSTYYKANNTSESEGPSENIVSASKDMQNHKAERPELKENEPDFYSLTESSTNTSAKNLKANEVMSSGSENYMSPAKSSGSEKPNEDTTESKEVDEVSHLLNILGEKRAVTHEAFSEIDHRLKLHLEINVFKEDEELEACLQTSIVPLSTGDEFLGLFALSSKKVYVIKFLPKYSLNLQLNESIEKAIQIVHSTTLNQLSQIKIILGSQGLTIGFGSSSRVYTLVIRDADICNSFTSLLSDFVQEHDHMCGGVEFLSSADETLQSLKESVFSSAAESEEMPEILLHLFAFWWDSRTQENDASHPVCVIVTAEDIFISKILYKKQESVPDLTVFCAYHYSLINHQKLSDLVSLKLKNDLRSVEIHFLDESSFVENQDSVFWTIKMETKSALFSLISALKNPWEEIFGVPLSLTCEEE